FPARPAADLSLGLVGLPLVAWQVPQQSPNPDITRQELANFDQFLDTHPEIAKQLQANPSLINNPEWVENHPDLRAFLASHPGVREEIQETPRFFMERERRFENSENRPGNPNPDITSQELATFDRFLDTQKEIAKDLKQNPALVNDPEFVKKHKDLRSFLKNHPEVREEVRENPSRFMPREARLERHDAGKDRDAHRNDNHGKKDNYGKKDDHQKKDKDKHKKKIEEKESLKPNHPQ